LAGDVVCCCCCRAGAAAATVGAEVAFGFRGDDDDDAHGDGARALTLFLYVVASTLSDDCGAARTFPTVSHVGGGGRGTSFFGIGVGAGFHTGATAPVAPTG